MCSWRGGYFTLPGREIARRILSNLRNRNGAHTPSDQDCQRRSDLCRLHTEMQFSLRALIYLFFVASVSLAAIAGVWRQLHYFSILWLPTWWLAAHAYKINARGDDRWQWTAGLNTIVLVALTLMGLLMVAEFQCNQKRQYF